MPKAYTERFLYFFGNATVATYTVPAGKRAVIKSLVGFNGGTATGVISLKVQGSIVWAAPVPGSNGGTSVNVTIAVYAGEGMVLSTLANSMGACLSGYLFDDPPAAGTLPSEPPDAVYEPGPSPKDQLAAA